MGVHFSGVSVKRGSTVVPILSSFSIAATTFMLILDTSYDHACNISIYCPYMFHQHMSKHNYPENHIYSSRITCRNVFGPAEEIPTSSV